MFYNPNLEPPKAKFGTIREVEPQWAEHYAKIDKYPFKPYPTYEEALNSNWSGTLRFYKDGIMYQGSHTPASAYKPCIGVQCWPGINWDTYFACDKEELMEYLKTKYTELYGEHARYNEEFGVWSIQVHYDGRCR